MSPPFHVNFTLGVHFLQAPAEVDARAVPIRFQGVSRAFNFGVPFCMAHPVSVFSATAIEPR